MRLEPGAPIMWWLQSNDSMSVMFTVCGGVCLFVPWCQAACPIHT